MSRGWGWLAERNVPETFRPTVFGFYSTAFGVNLEEAAVADFKYVNFCNLFLTHQKNNVEKKEMILYTDGSAYVNDLLFLTW